MQKPFTLFSLKKRILALTLVISFIFCSLVVRLFFIQVIDSSSLQRKATDQWTRDLAIVAPRGKILDSTGDVLVVSYTTYNVFVRGREVQNKSETAFVLSKELNLSYEKVYQKVSKKNISEVLIKMQVEGDIAQSIYNKNLSGVYLAENCKRYYTYGNLLSQGIGFTSIDNVGQSGVEAYYEKYLKGVDGCSFVQSDLQGKEIGGSLRYYIPSQSGNDIVLSVDSKMQLILEKTLEKIMVEQKAKGVCGMIINPKTNSLLALSNKPSFDLNDVPRDDLSSLFENSKVKAVTDNYEPGSTFKILTVAMALEEGLTSINDHFYCPGYRIVDGVKIKCWKTLGHGSQTLKEAFANSCNCCFMDLALRIGKDKFYSYAQKFNLGKKTGIDIKGETSGILMDKSLVKNVDLARMGFGHAIALTPIQLMSAVSAIVNGGEYHKPYLVQKIVSQEGKTVLDKTSSESRCVISQSTSQIVNSLLEFAENKTGAYTFVEGYNVGGKTGTAQKYKEGGGIWQGKYISSFIGSYPADNPRYTVFVMVDEPSNGAYYGSIVAAPYGKEIFGEMFSYLNEEKQDPNAKTEYVTMPNLIDKSLTESVKIISEMGLLFEIDGEGDFVADQLPPEGTVLAKGTTILIKT